MKDRSLNSEPTPFVGRNPEGVVTGNVFDKYRSRNAVHRWLTRGFFRAAKELLETVQPRRVVEVGCASGDLAYQLFGNCAIDGDGAVEYSGIDIGPLEVQTARARYPAFHFEVASAYELPFPDGCADLVLACEVFEHLEDPERALLEIERICGAYLLLSVPWEPIWRALNVLRGSYLRELGNTPGHVQHFGRSSICRLVNSRFEVLTVRKPLPWTMLLARKRGPR